MWEPDEVFFAVWKIVLLCAIVQNSLFSLCYEWGYQWKYRHFSFKILILYNWLKTLNCIRPNEILDELSRENMKTSLLLWLHKVKSKVLWYLMNVYMINGTLHSRVEKYSTREMCSLMKCFSAVEEKFGISKEPCNILYICVLKYYCRPWLLEDKKLQLHALQIFCRLWARLWANPFRDWTSIVEPEWSLGRGLWIFTDKNSIWAYIIAICRRQPVISSNSSFGGRDDFKVAITPIWIDTVLQNYFMRWTAWTTNRLFILQTKS